MEIAARKPLRDSLTAFTRAYTAMLPTDQIRGVLTRGGASNKISRQFNNDVRLLNQAGKVLQDVFYVGDNDVFSDGNFGLTPYANALNKQLMAVTWAVIQAHNQFLQEALPADLYLQLRRQSRATAPIGIVAEQDDPKRREFYEKWAHLRIFDERALNSYQSPHVYQIDGARLSNRIWETGNETRKLFLKEVNKGIQAGHSAETIANNVFRFLNPQVKNQTTRKPYGRKISYPAMRLARNEITTQWGQSTLVAARLNPFVEKIDWRLSGSHKHRDICDVNAENGPYDLYDVPPYPAHIQDMCNLVPLVVSNRDQVTADIRQALIEAQQLGIQPYVNPSNPRAMMEALFGPALAAWFFSQIGEWLGVQ